MYSFSKRQTRINFDKLKKSLRTRRRNQAEESCAKEDLNSFQSMDVKLSGIYVPNNTEVKKPAGYRSPGWLTILQRALWNKEKACSEREND